MKNKVIIGILGESQCGKDYLVNNLGLPKEESEVIKFADNLKITAQGLHPSLFSKDLWENSGDLYREEFIISLEKTRRSILTDLAETLEGKGIDFKYGPTLERVQKSKCKYIVITDVRVEEEVLFSKSSLGATIVKIDRELADRHPKEWEVYSKSTKDITIDGFREFCKLNFPSIYKKWNAKSEVGVNLVPEHLIDFQFKSSPDKGVYESNLQTLKGQLGLGAN